MLQMQILLQGLSKSVTGNLLVIAITTINLLFNVIANVSFKYSAFSSNWRGFTLWQIIGNLAGFVTVLTLTWLLRYVPLDVAFPVTTGLAVLGVQVTATFLIFHESITLMQWLGTLLVILGILLISKG